MLIIILLSIFAGLLLFGLLYDYFGRKSFTEVEGYETHKAANPNTDAARVTGDVYRGINDGGGGF